MSNLSQFQQKLINELTNEFKKLNPQTKSDNGVKRFNLNSITNCINEEEKFAQTMAKHNLTMMKVFLNQLKEEIKGFKKEFGKVMDLQFGYLPSTNYAQKHNVEMLESYVKTNPLYDPKSHEIYLFIVSKTKVFDRGNANYNFCNGKSYTQVYVRLETNRESVTLESGKIVSFPKIVGLNYSTENYLSSNKTLIPTLDGLIQSSTSLQQRLVSLVQ